MYSTSCSRHNPNPKLNSKNQSSSTKINKNKNPKTPNWLDLPEDVWSLIFSKLYTIHLIENVQKVCMLFRKICKQPSLYKVVDMTLPNAFMDLDFDANIMTQHIVDRSCGALLDIYLEFVCDDDTLMYIVERSKNLKHMRLGHYLYISDEGLIDAVKRLPELEELEIIICSYSEETIELTGHACPSLKSFSLNGVGSRDRGESYNEEALAIAKSMPNLRSLQLIGNLLNHEGLKAILDGCPHLESLDLHACFRVVIAGDLGKRCGEIKHLRLPNDSTADYSHTACTDSEQNTYFRRPRTSYYDSDYMDFYRSGPYVPDYVYSDDSGDEYLYFSNDEFDSYPSWFLTGAGQFDYDSSD